METKLKKCFIIPMLMVFWCCSSQPGKETEMIQSTFVPLNADYNRFSLVPTKDTVHFLLDEGAYNKVKSFNAFVENDSVYLSFFDKRAFSVDIYNLQSKQKVKAIKIDESIGGKDLVNVTIYTKSFDSIFINSINSLYVMDSSRRISRTIRWNKSKYKSEVIMENTGPPVVKDSLIYTGVRPTARYRDQDYLQQWKILFEFNTNSKKSQVLYHLPRIYQDSTYGFFYQDYSYCINKDGLFVISFPADTNIYETDLRKYHMAYNGRSKEHKRVITSMSKVGESVKEEHQHYSNNFAYGPIFFDPYHNRYIRISKDAVEGKVVKGEKAPRHIIIFDDMFRIIGESELPTDVLFTSFFFTPDGKVYARTLISDEYAFHFVRMDYVEQDSMGKHLTSK